MECALMALVSPPGAFPFPSPQKVTGNGIGTEKVAGMKSIFCSNLHQLWNKADFKRMTSTKAYF